MTSQFDPKTYWESRLASRFDLRGVGDIGLPESYNRFLYQVRARAFGSIIRSLRLERSRFDALDIGSGTGFYVGEWLRRSPRSLTGSDLTEAAVTRLQARFPQAEFIQCDIGAQLPASLAGRQFDVVSAMDMLFHIVEDDRYATAFINFARLVKPSGRLIFSENLMRTRKNTVPHQISRSENEVREVLRRTGLEIERISPMFALMNDPVRSDSRLLRKAFATIYRFASNGETAGALAGALIYPVELLAIGLLPRGPSTEIFVCRRVAELS
jgi:2-polyprenyl-3-methyl-5-hydroxy-6-metoxy-1,4-benzoquinol methylase